jgi:hypothetical protein
VPVRALPERRPQQARSDNEQGDVSISMMASGYLREADYASGNLAVM